MKRIRYTRFKDVKEGEYFYKGTFERPGDLVYQRIVPGSIEDKSYNSVVAIPFGSEKKYHFFHDWDGIVIIDPYDTEDLEALKLLNQQRFQTRRKSFGWSILSGIGYLLVCTSILILQHSPNWLRAIVDNGLMYGAVLFGIWIGMNYQLYLDAKKQHERMEQPK